MLFRSGGMADPVRFYILHQGRGGQKARDGRLDSGWKVEQVRIPMAADEAGRRLGDQGSDDLVDIGPELQPDDELVRHDLFARASQKLLPGEQALAGRQDHQQRNEQSSTPRCAAEPGIRHTAPEAPVCERWELHSFILAPALYPGFSGGGQIVPFRLPTPHGTRPRGRWLHREEAPTWRKKRAIGGGTGGARSSDPDDASDMIHGIDPPIRQIWIAVPWIGSRPSSFYDKTVCH